MDKYKLCKVFYTYDFPGNVKKAYDEICSQLEMNVQVFDFPLLLSRQAINDFYSNENCLLEHSLVQNYLFDTGAKVFDNILIIDC